MELFIAIIGITCQFMGVYIGNAYFINNKQMSFRRMLSIMVGIIITIIIYLFWGVYSAIFIFILNFIYNYLVLKKIIASLGIQSLVMILNVLADHLSSWVLSVIGGDYSSVYIIIIHLALAFSLSLVALFVIKKATESEFIKHVDAKEGDVVSIILFFTYIVYLVCIILGVQLGNTIEQIQLNLFFFIVYFLCSLLAFYLYSKSLRKELHMKQTKAAYDTIQQYTAGLEAQYNQIRTFKHDYQNILTSLESYIYEKDWENLENYFTRHVLESAHLIHGTRFQLDDLGNIYVKEIKSIFMSKLIQAQSIGIETLFECREPIDRFQVDSLVLIRILGILLDNAIEATYGLTIKNVHIAVIKYNNGKKIIIKNSCSDHIPPLSELKKKGFSTKGSERGLGLSNVAAFIKGASHLMLETCVEENTFTQIIYIEET